MTYNKERICNKCLKETRQAFLQAATGTRHYNEDSAGSFTTDVRPFLFTCVR